jgi:hypothetical protein
MLKAPKEVGGLDLPSELRTAERDNHALVPIIVVDELDRLEGSKDG